MPENSGDAVDRAVNAMVRLEPSLKGRESQVAVIVVTAMADYLKERGEFVGGGPRPSEIN
jgi:hypothetical protein